MSFSKQRLGKIVKAFLLLVLLPVAAFAGPIYRYNFVGQASDQTGYGLTGYIQLPSEAAVPGTNLFPAITKARFSWTELIEDEPGVIRRFAVRMSTEPGESRITDLGTGATSRWLQGNLDDGLYGEKTLVLDGDLHISTVVLCSLYCYETDDQAVALDGGPDSSTGNPFFGWVATGGRHYDPNAIEIGGRSFLQSGIGSWSGPVSVPEPSSWLLLLAALGVMLWARGGSRCSSAL